MKHYHRIFIEKPEYIVLLEMFFNEILKFKITKHLKYSVERVETDLSSVFLMNNK